MAPETNAWQSIACSLFNTANQGSVDMQSTAMTDSVDSPAAEVAVKATWSSMSTAPGLTPSST